MICGGSGHELARKVLWVPLSLVLSLLSLYYTGKCCGQSEAPLYKPFLCTGGSALLQARSRGSTLRLASASREISPERNGGHCWLLFHLCVSEGHVSCMTGLQPWRRPHKAQKGQRILSHFL